MWNFSRISRCHCSARCGGQSTASRVDLAPVEQLAGDERASTVLPMPTSSAMSSRTGSWRSAMSSGTSWYGRGSTAIRPKLRKGPAPCAEPRPQRLAEQARRGVVAEVGRGRAARRWRAGPCSRRRGRSPATSSSVPPSGRRTSRSSLGLGQDDPLAAAGADEGPREAEGEASRRPRLAEDVGVLSRGWRASRLVIAERDHDVAGVLERRADRGVALGDVRVVVDGAVDEDDDRARVVGEVGAGADARRSALLRRGRQRVAAVRAGSRATRARGSEPARP